MTQPQLTDHMKQCYERHYKAFVAALKESIDLPLATYCRENGVDCRSFTSWLSRYKELTPLEVRNNVRKELGMKPAMGRGQLEYDKYLKAYRDMLAVDLDYTLTQYCEDMGLSTHAFHHWLRRKGLTVDKIKQEVCEGLNIEPTEGTTPGERRLQRKATEPKVFRKALAGFKKALERDTELSLQKFCRAKGYAYRPLLHWMREIGINPSDIKAFVKDRNKLPKDNRRVFIQFKPNGGHSGDLLNGVRISLPDGSQIDVESCTVVGLCSFVNIYSKQQES